MTGNRRRSVSIPVGRLLRRGAFVAAATAIVWLEYVANPPDRRGEFSLLAAEWLFGGFLALTLLFSVPLTISRLHREAEWKRRACAVAIFIVLVMNGLLFTAGAWAYELSWMRGSDENAITILLGSIFVLLGPLGRVALDVDAHANVNHERHSRAVLHARGVLVGAAFVACVTLAVAAITYIPMPPPDPARMDHAGPLTRDEYRYFDLFETRRQAIACTLLFVTGVAMFATVLRLFDKGRIARLAYWSVVFVMSVGCLSLFRFGYWKESSSMDPIRPWLTLGAVFLTLPVLRRVLRAVRAHWSSVDHL